MSLLSFCSQPIFDCLGGAPPIAIIYRRDTGAYAGTYQYAMPQGDRAWPESPHRIGLYCNHGLDRTLDPVY